MKTARLLVLGVALAAGLGAAMIVSGTRPPEPVKEVVRAPAIPMDDVLVTTKALDLGTVLQEGDIKWQSWPKDSIPAGFISKSAEPNALNEVKGEITRSSFAAGQPLQTDRLVKAGNAGFMSAMLTPGYRAFAITIEPNGTSTAGGFILPNDHVDIIRTYRDEEAVRQGGTDVMASETIVRNVRVLAIGQTLQNGEKTVVGQTATLELTPRQAEILALAQHIPNSQLSLALRSLEDSKGNDSKLATQQTDVTIIRNGIATQARLH